MRQMAFVCVYLCFAMLLLLIWKARSRMGTGHDANPINFVEADKLGRSELHYAAARGDATSVADLIQAGSSVNLADVDGLAPLHFACQSQSFECVKLLLQAGAEPDSRDKEGATPIATAVYYYRGDKSIISILLKHSANPQI